MPLAYAGPPDPTGLRVLSAWTLDPAMVALIVALGIAYAVGLRRARTPWPPRRTVAFAAGLVVIALATMSGLGDYAHALFSVYTVQIVLLLMVAPLLLAAGRPIGLAQVSLPEPAAERLSAILASRPARVLTSPLISPVFLAAVPFALYFTGWYADTLVSYPQYELLHVALLAVGFVVQYPLWEPAEYGYPYPVLLLFAFIELLIDAVPGIVLRLETHLVAPAYYLALGRGWGPTPLGDQHMGADILWCVAETIDLPFLILFLVRWVQADRVEAARSDAAEPEDEDGRPWWERDASVFGDRAARFRR